MSTPLNEAQFIQIYRELTDASEAQARSAFIYACCAEDAMNESAFEKEAAYRADPKWEEELSYEPAAESRSLSYVHQLSRAAHEQFA